MAIFIDVLESKDKSRGLKCAIDTLNKNESDRLIYEVNPDSFGDIPGAPYSYWSSDEVRQLFGSLEPVAGLSFKLGKGPDSGDDFRFLRLWWEVKGEPGKTAPRWVNHPKGGEFSRYYSDPNLVMDWSEGGDVIKLHGNQRNPAMMNRPGLTWSRRTTSSLSVRILPYGCVFGDKGPAVVHDVDDEDELMSLLAIMNSSAFASLVMLQLSAADAAARSYEVGIISKTPLPKTDSKDREYLAQHAKAGWSIKSKVDTTNETSHFFIMPLMLQERCGLIDVAKMTSDYESLQLKINQYVDDLYGMKSDEHNNKLNYRADTLKFFDHKSYAVLSWCLGVLFGRFNPDFVADNSINQYGMSPFSELPIENLGMRENSGVDFTKSNGVLVDVVDGDSDLSLLVQKVLEHVDVSVDFDVGEWFRKEFFSYHLLEYSKSRRQAPVYWPIQVPSGTYTIWVYYSEVNEQTLFTLINDYVGPNLVSLSENTAALRNTKDRSKIEEGQLVKFVALEEELKDFHDELLEVAQFWKPNFHDGVQITAAPLWHLFQHKAWQKKLRKTWEELKQGKYDWSHMAYNVWPERVLTKCWRDRGIAIAHGVEGELWEKIEIPAARGKGTNLVWRSKEMTEAELDAYIQHKVAKG
jgi:hypothetical protein